MKISVIIPVYNAEKSISYIVETLLSQTFKDFEILLINDGSTDNTAIICNQYAAKYSDSNNSHHPIIRVFHKMNGGVAMANSYYRMVTMLVVSIPYMPMLTTG